MAQGLLCLSDILARLGIIDGTKLNAVWKYQTVFLVVWAHLVLF